MPKKLVIVAKIIDDDGKTISSEEISQKVITPPTDTSNFGYSRVEQLEIIKNVQQSMLDNQVDFLKSET